MNAVSSKYLLADAAPDTERSFPTQKTWSRGTTSSTLLGLVHHVFDDGSSDNYPFSLIPRSISRPSRSTSLSELPVAFADLCLQCDRNRASEDSHQAA